MPIASSTRSRVSLRRTSAPGFVTTASVPPPNSTAVARRSCSWAAPVAAVARSPRRSQRSSGEPSSPARAVGEPGRRGARRRARRRPRCRGAAGSSGGSRRRRAAARAASTRSRRTPAGVDAGGPADLGLQPRGAGANDPPRRRRPSRRDSGGATTRTARPSTPAAARRACRRRPRSVPRGSRTPPSVDGPRRRRGGSPGGPRPPCQLRVAPCVSQSAEPSPWREPRAGSSARQDLVDVVEQRRRLHGRPVDGDPVRRDARRQEAGDLGHGPRVRDEPGRRIEGGAAGPRQPRARGRSSTRW